MTIEQLDKANKLNVETEETSNAHQKDEKPCSACRFWMWDLDRKEYGCTVKGCWEKSKFQLFDFFNPKHR